MKYLLPLIFTLGSCIITQAQSPKTNDPRPHFSAIIVNDMSISVTWYKEILGLEVLDSVSSEERGFKITNLKRGDLLIELIELKSAISRQDFLEGKGSKARLTGLFKFGLSVNDFDVWVGHFNDQQVQFQGEVVRSHLTDKRMVIILDPDGNRIQVFEQ
ncbi:MAG: VOC family protein [Bacteroidota bacterium]